MQVLSSDKCHFSKRIRIIVSSDLLRVSIQYQLRLSSITVAEAGADIEASNVTVVKIPDDCRLTADLKKLRKLKWLWLEP
jgi:hypothetical protein